MDEKVKKISEVKAHMTREAFRIYDEMAAKLPPASSTLKEVKFSSSMINVIGRCYFKRGYIKFSLPHISANLDNPEFQRRLIIHEVAHFFVPNHGPSFVKLCEEFGAPNEGSTSKGWEESGVACNYVKTQGIWECPHCGKKIAARTIPDEHRIRKKRCPNCRNRGLKYNSI